jgi:hypothetical protein
MASANYLLKAVFMVLSLMPLKVLLLHAAKGSIQLTRPSTPGQVELVFAYRYHGQIAGLKDQ